MSAIKKLKMIRVQGHIKQNDLENTKLPEIDKKNYLNNLHEKNRASCLQCKTTLE